MNDTSNYYVKNLHANKLQKCYEIAPPRIQQFLKAEIDFILTKLSANDTVLDLGCGYGRVAIELAKSAGKVIGIDISAENIELAKKMYGQIDVLQFYEMNAVKLDFPANTFDVVICCQNGISAFKEDPDLLLTEALRVTKKEGLLLFSSYSNKIWEERLNWFQLQADEELLEKIDYTQTKNGIIVCENGFKAITYSGYDFLTLTSKYDVDTQIYEVDDSCIFCAIKKK